MNTPTSEDRMHMRGGRLLKMLCSKSQVWYGVGEKVELTHQTSIGFRRRKRIPRVCLELDNQVKRTSNRGNSLTMVLFEKVLNKFSLVE